MDTSQDHSHFLYLVHHVFLPPQLPQHDDFATSLDQNLVNSVLKAMEHFKYYVRPENMAIFQCALGMMHSLSSTRHSGQLNSDDVGKALCGLVDGGCLVFELRAQNLGLFIQRREDIVQFEPFELLAENKQVNSCAGRLRRTFPACCIELTHLQYQVPQFQAALVNMLGQLDADTHASCRPQSTKKGNNDEERDTVIPRMIGPVVGFLRGLGKETVAFQFLKHSREEVLWKNAKLPWHRSATWLLIRVALQLSLSRQGATQPSRRLYKEFMVFLVSKLIKQATRLHVADELLYCMIAKFNRRWYKFSRTPGNSFYLPGWLNYSTGVLQMATTSLELNWEAIRRDGTHELQLESLRDLDFTSDIFLKLAGLKRFVDATSSRNFDQHPTRAPNAAFDFTRFACDEVPVMNMGKKGILDFVMADVEQWIAVHLPRWLGSHTNESDACKRLAELLNSYVSAAGKNYARNPHNLSIMWLSVMELWVACDRAATEQVPLLLDYSVGFPKGFLESLVLPLRSQMLRLRDVELYLEKREVRAKPSCPSAFEGFGQANSFAPRYYHSSDFHQQLHQEIISLANQERNEKLLELERSTTEYQTLKLKYESRDHNKELVGSYQYGWETRCRRKCSKCYLGRKMKDMRIWVHEWPLPDDKVEAQTVVFELQVPSIISDWRHLTMTLLNDLLRDSRQTASTSDSLYSPLDYAELATRAKSVQLGRLGLMSLVKPFTASHYRDTHVSEASVTTICKDHRCQYTYYDVELRCPVSDVIEGLTVPSNCSFAVASNLPLPDWIRDYTHTSNEVIAQQSLCPQNLTLDAFRAIGHIRSGARLQWWNILVQLNSPVVDFNNIEVALTILQAIGECGPCVDSESDLRDSHMVVQDEKFAGKLLDGLQATLLRFQENWECDISLFTLASLCNRVLALSKGDTIWSACCQFGRQIRSVALHWVDKLLSKRAGEDSATERSELNDRILAMALVISTTFDADVEHTGRIFSDGQSVTDFLEASILIHDHQPTDLCTLSSVALVSLQAWRRLCYRYQETITTRIALDRGCIDRAVLNFWANYKPGNGWESLQVPRNHVVTSVSSVSRGQKKLVVSLDILQGRLLVNGRPLSRLPAEYEAHPTYIRLFGSQILEIAPSDEPGLEYTAVRKQNGWLLHLGMVNGELIIRACADGSTWEFVPPWHLHDDLPESLIIPYSHWRNTCTGELELREVQQPWSSQNRVWKSQVLPGGRITLVNGDLSLIEPTSCIAKKIVKLLSPIEVAGFITISLSRSSATLQIDMCRLNLSFTLQSGSCTIRSRKHPGMCIDSDQSLSTLFGLRNKLILRPQNTRNNKKRIVIIPDGRLGFRRDMSSHPITTIEFPLLHISAQDPSPRHIVRRRYHCYEIDNDLGRLVDNGSLQSKLLICYLHAVTAHCLPDPLTSRTGTEEALRILKSAAVMSFPRLQTEEIQLLSQIARLSPIRSFYPPHLTEMQHVDWLTQLSALGQHDEFALIAEEILNEGQYSEMFSPEIAQSIQLPEGTHPKLRQRALIRSSCFRVDGFGAENFCKLNDLDYRGRDVMELLSSKCLEQRVCQITRSLLLGRPLQISKIASVRHLADSLYATFGAELADRQTSPLLPIGLFAVHWLDEPSKTIGEYWFAIQKHLTTVQIADSRYDLMTFFAALVYANHAQFDIVQLLLALVCASPARNLQQPSYDQFELGHGRVYNALDIRHMIGRHKKSFASTPESSLLAWYGETAGHLHSRRNQTWQSKVASLTNQLETFISHQYSAAKPVSPTDREFSQYFDITSVMKSINQRFQSWKRNSLLDSYLMAIIEATANLPENSVTESLLEISAQMLVATPTGARQPFIMASELFHQTSLFSCKEAYALQDMSLPHPGPRNQPDSGSMGASKPAEALLASLRSLAVQDYPKYYVSELETSFASYRATCTAESNMQTTANREELEARLVEHVQTCATQVKEMQGMIYNYLRDAFIAVFPSLLYYIPRLSPIFILQQLNRHHWPSVPAHWKHCIEQYALALIFYQRAKRMLSVIDNHAELAKEVENIGHAWDLRGFPEWLLLEVESGLIIRDVQAKVASSMQSSTENRVMQLNMGEGKSSVIVPIVVAHLADGNRLIRVIVAKPQSKQMRHMLVTKIGGLLDRRVFFLPFSRSIIMNSDMLESVQKHFESCRKAGGVLLVQPEQLLSFKLMGIEYVGSPGSMPKSADARTGRGLIKSQRYLETYSRDVIDESDENFSVNFELIYTIGRQRPVEMSPDRWIVIQQVLEIIHRRALDFAEKYPDGFELKPGSSASGQFPRLRFLKEEPGNLLLKHVARCICENGLHRFPIAHQPPETRQLVFEYITDANFTGDKVDTESGIFFCDSTRDVLLLLRGLFACGVLAFAFRQKRWRVNYGLAKRVPPTQLAVPYRAKDSPSPRSEFSHPDVVIILTQLSYYYGGLSDDEMFTAFQQLQRLDQASMLYVEWVNRAPALPSSFRQLSGVNLKDRSQCINQIFPVLRHTKAFVDFYLGQVVFPSEMVEFPQKLSASGWDLAKPRAQAVTGFSGTCDSKYVLPTDISHIDLPHQLHTNAKVLDYLLRPENLVVELGHNIDGTSILREAVNVEQPVDVILDVGALIIDLGNRQVAQKWLELTTDKSEKQAVIFVDDEDEILVLDRNGLVEPFLISSFVDNTASCLVYLDEAHTRGIDLKLPDHYRAATTLGPRLTKDRLVQACMRMRKLGKGQSVSFFTPVEIQQKIRSVRSLREDAPITNSDVLVWSISETWSDTCKNVPLWAIQGLRHQHQEAIWGAMDLSASRDLARSDLAEYFEDEAMTLEQRYSPKAGNMRQVLDGHSSGVVLSQRQEQMSLIHEKCRQFSIDRFGAATLQEEQERELAPEIEQERQVERPQPAIPLKHALHPDLHSLIGDGLLRLTGGGYEAAFTSLKKCSAASLVNLQEFGGNLLTTRDFARTVRLTGTSTSDAFQRPVQWILTTKAPWRPEAYMIILSPFEANKLLPSIRRSPHVTLHVYAPRLNLLFPCLQDLTLYTTPPLPAGWTTPLPYTAVLRLNLFAGQLYFQDWQEYRQLCEYLGLSCTSNDGGAAAVSAVDGFVGRCDRYPRCQFTRSPTAFLQFLTATVRRDGQDIGRTHVGRLLAGEVLTQDDFLVTQ